VGTKGSLLCSQEPTTGPYLERDESSRHHPTLLFKIHSNIILPSMPGLQSGLSLPTKTLYTFLICHVHHMP